jgi:hypothetical protein
MQEKCSMLNIFSLQNLPSRTKRAIDVIGEIASWCCGVTIQLSLDDIFVSEKNLNTFVSQGQVTDLRNGKSSHTNEIKSQ